MGVPITMGCNWFILSYGSAGVAESIVKNPLLQIVVAAGLMTGVDVLIEPVATQLDFWQWKGCQIPIQNYVMWFIVSTGLHAIIRLTRLRFNKKMAYLIFLIQVVFFGVLTLFLALN